MLHDTADNRIVGFTLVELLTVLAVMSLLMGILFPALHQARESARQLVCSSNLNQIGKAMGVYVADTTFYPAAYLYDDDTTEDPRILHWSGLFVQQGLLHEDVFGCPSLRCDGLPPSHTRDDNLEDGQVNVTPGLEDLQVDRCAYTVNEALLPRNRFTEGFEGACRVSRYVRAACLRGSSGTILATEWTDNWLLLAQDGVCRSYLPIHGFQGIGPMGEDRYDLNLVGSSSDHPCLETSLFRQLPLDLLSDNPSPARTSPPRLDWVGRFHKGRAGLTNFLYADGHMECKSIYDTLGTEFEWGRGIYSVKGGMKVCCD